MALLALLPVLAFGQSVSGLVLEPSSVVGGAASRGVITLDTAATGAGLRVNLSSSSSIAHVGAYITVPAGATTAKFGITTTAVAGTDTAVITASGNGTATATLTVQSPGIRNVICSPNPVIGGNPVTGTVNITGPAPTGGLTVSLASDDPCAVVPASVNVSAGASAATFGITTPIVKLNTFSHVTATLGSSTGVRALYVYSPAVTSLSLSPATVTGGTSVTGTVTIASAAGSDTVQVRLRTDNSAVTVPSSVFVPSGATQVTFTATTSAVASARTVNVFATTSGSPVSQSVTINPPGLSSLTLNPTAVQGKYTSRGTVTLSGPAAAGGFDLALASNQTFATVPASVHIPTGATSAAFTIMTSVVNASQTATITASFGGVNKAADLLVHCPPVKSMTISPNSAAWGYDVTGTVNLTQPAPAGGETVSLSADKSYVHPPATVVVPAGTWFTTFPISSTATDLTEVATVTATAGGVSVTATYTVIKQASTPWPQMHGNAQNTGLSIGRGVKGTLAWGSYTAGDMAALGVGNRVVFIERPNNQSPLYWRLINVQAETGVVMWWFNLPGFDEHQQCPAVGPDGTVYVTSKVSLYAFNVNGVLLWTVPLGSAPGDPDPTQFATTSGVVVGTDGTVYVGVTEYRNGSRTYHTYLGAFNGTTGAVKWKNFNAGWANARCCIGYDGTIYSVRDHYLGAYKPADGSEKWLLDVGATEQFVYTMPAVGEDGAIFVDSLAGHMIAVNPNGTLRWKSSFSTYQSADLEGRGPMIGKDGTVFAFGNEIRAFDPLTGATKWNVLYSQKVRGFAIDLDGVLYVGTRDGYIRALNSATGAEKWKLNVTYNWIADHKPAMGADGVLYFGRFAIK
ncbi:PQQ-binding-like beta-propeller repeat protein [Fimbriimonas ginsengisoli]|uniref:outer membrane protein assembly factor BamB family protein n=1 Tax=Fimbriimonas ginsengisoli TaxID=1005039 RepID=UPI00046C9781|nr:PQQ-binding-like beta-propeller repeat protein [Fimbriimonas ginsengisoli]